MIAAAPNQAKKRTRVALHALADGADAIDYAALPPSDPRVLHNKLDIVEMTIENVEYAIAHYQRLLPTLQGERAYLQRRLGVR
jgi:hypothetical protein